MTVTFSLGSPLNHNKKALGHITGYLLKKICLNVLYIMLIFATVNNSINTIMQSLFFSTTKKSKSRTPHQSHDFALWFSNSDIKRLWRLNKTENEGNVQLEVFLLFFCPLS